MSDRHIFVLFMLVFSTACASLATLMVYRVLQSISVLP